MDAFELREMLTKFLESDAGKLLMAKLNETERYIHIVEDNGMGGWTCVWVLTGKGFMRSTESSALSAAFTGKLQDVSTSDSNLREVVDAVVSHGDWCCEAAFMYWLEHCTVEEEGRPFPKSDPSPEIFTDGDSLFDPPA